MVNTVLITWYDILDTITLLTVIKEFYDYIIVSKEYTKTGLVHYHALAHGIKKTGRINILSLRNSLRKKYKKNTENKTLFTKYNFNIQLIDSPRSGYYYVIKDGEIIINTLPKSIIDIWTKTGIRGCGTRGPAPIALNPQGEVSDSTTKPARGEGLEANLCPKDIRKTGTDCYKEFITENKI